MNIRHAQERDIPRLAHILLQVNALHAAGRPDLFKAGARKYTDEELGALIADPKSPILVCTDEADCVVGYAFCQLHEPAQNHVLQPVRTLYIDDLCVDEASRGKHVGTQLYKAVMALARELHCYNVTLNVWTCNPTAMRFYEQMGLKPQKIGMETILE